MGCLVRLHEAVSDHVRDNHVGVLDSSHVRAGNVNIELREGRQLALRPVR